MDMASLCYFVEACKGKTLTAIADQAHISRQAVSQSLQSLEYECGVQLIERTKSGCRMTLAGERLFPHAKLIVDTAALALEELRTIGEYPTLYVGYGKMTHNLWLWNHVDEFNQSHTEFRVERSIAGQNELLESLNQGSLDLVVSNMLLTDKRYKRMLLRKSQAFVIASRDDFPEIPNEITPEMLCGKEILLLPGNVNFNERLKNYINDQTTGCSFGSAATDDILGILQYLNQRRGCIYVSSGIFRKSVSMPEHLFFARLSNRDDLAPKKDTYAYWLASNPRSRIVQVYANYLKRNIRQE